MKKQKDKKQIKKFLVELDQTSYDHNVSNVLKGELKRMFGEQVEVIDLKDKTKEILRKLRKELLEDYEDGMAFYRDEKGVRHSRSKVPVFEIKEIIDKTLNTGKIKIVSLGHKR